MSYRSILAVYSGEADGRASLAMAVGLQRAWDLHVTGLAWHGLNTLQRHWRGVLPRDIEDMLAERDADTVSEIRDRFMTALRERGDPSRAAFLEIAGNGSLSLAETARGFDLVVMGRRSSETGLEHFSARPDVVALRSGRPVMVTPPNHPEGPLPQRVVIGWDGKRNAARAILDALPFLIAADEVLLLSIGKAPPERKGAEILNLLKHHGVKARQEIRAEGRGNIGRQILDAAQELGAGILVIGAYEHSKFHEDLLGGVTNLLLEQAHLPVLMSH